MVRVRRRPGIGQRVPDQDTSSSATTEAKESTKRQHLPLIAIIASLLLTNYLVIVKHVSPIKKSTRAQANRKTASLSMPAPHRTATQPNVIFIVHDSLSGSVMLNTEQGRKATPFIQTLLQDENMYFFRNARGVSGATVDSIPAIASGCHPFTEKGRNIAFKNWIGSEFKRLEWQTASFCSALPVEGKKPFDYVSMDMDVVVNPATTGHETIEEQADDRLNLPLLGDWIQRNVTRPFFAYFYGFNTHSPYLRDKNSTFFKESSYLSALETLDDFYKRLFDNLRSSGNLDNTIIIGTSDHGENMQGPSRNSQWGPAVLHVASYMYVPEKMFPSARAREILKGNLNKTVSVVDLFPTMQHLLYGGSSADTVEARIENKAANVSGDEYQNHCITGFDLMSETIPQDRLAFSWNVIAEPKSSVMLAAISNSEQGLFYRRGIEKRGGNGMFQIDFRKECTAHQFLPGNICRKTASRADAVYWKDLVAELYNSTRLSISVRESKLISEMRLELYITKRPQQIEPKEPQASAEHAHRHPNTWFHTNPTSLPVPTPVLVLGMPKAGTSSIRDFFRCNGNTVSHFDCQLSPHMLCGELIANNMAAGRPPLYHDVLAYQVYAEMSFVYDKARPNLSCQFPQVDDLEVFHEHYPNATLVLNNRDVDHWVRSVNSWGPMMKKFTACNLTGFPAGVGGPEAMRNFFISHIERVRDFAKKYPSHKFIEADIESDKIGKIMANAFNASESCWGQSNTNRRAKHNKRS